MPGGIVVHHRPATASVAPMLIIAPHSACITGRPSPRNDSPARVSIVQPQFRGAITRTGVRLLGRTWRNKVSRRGTPEIAADSQILDRFKNELLLAHRITHRNVARLYEFHRAGEAVYLSMEYVEGESLRALLETAGKIELARGMELARQLCAGLREPGRRQVRGRRSRQIGSASARIAGQQERARTLVPLGDGESGCAERGALGTDELP